MTLVVAKRYDNYISICSDRLSADSSTGDFTLLKNDKIIKLGNWLIGYSGSFSLYDIIKYKLDDYEIFNKKASRKNLTKHIVWEIYNSLNKYNQLTNNNLPGELLFVSKNKLFIVQTNCSVITNDYLAIGSGKENAISLLNSTNFSCEQVIREVSKINIFVSEPAKEHIIVF